jgi:hypothetical protein
VLLHSAVVGVVFVVVVVVVVVVDSVVEVKIEFFHYFI